MRQTRLGPGLRLLRPPDPPPPPRGPSPPPDPADALLALLGPPDAVACAAVFPNGALLRNVAELLLRCTAQTTVTVRAGEGLVFLAADAGSGRLVHVAVVPGDLAHFHGPPDGAPLRCTIENASLLAVCQQLKRRDTVVLYADRAGQLGVLVDYSGAQSHTKHSMIGVRSVKQQPEFLLPDGYASTAVPVPSGVLQRIYREYKNSSKRVVIRGSAGCVHFSTDPRYSLQQIENIFGTPPASADDLDVTLELAVGTIGRIIKVTQFAPDVYFAFQRGLPLRITAPAGDHGSLVSIFLQQER